MSWEDDALCRTVSPDEFFPELGGSASYARQVCELCAVTSSCLAYALRRGEKWGVWGGTTPQERMAMPGWRDS
ncbi:WhiB family transcriptional regulator [Plantibacter sp. M259]|uniref:WhiB family transcriptional regulator n=1 Tax=Plantibacter sp. M259 TaxID=2583822 RepID=UPI00111049B4